MRIGDNMRWHHVNLELSNISVPETETSMTSMGWQAKDTGNKLFQEGAVGYVLQVSGLLAN